MSSYLRFLSIGLAAFWLILSGFWDNGLLLILGLASVILTLWLAWRIDRNYRLYSITQMMFRLPAYWGWLLTEIVKTNIEVVRCIWMPKRYPISPTLSKVPMTQSTRLGKTIYANSITITPGTVTVRLEPGEQLLVHALTTASIDDLKSGDMDSRVSALEEK